MLMTRKIPFLNGVRAFESAARLGSIKDAASELNVTPAAVSRMVKLLEERLGVKLFQRTANRLVLTPAGKAYQPGLTQIFDALSNLTEQVTSLSKRQVLTVGVGPTFATKWLIPRLGDFQKSAPEIDVHIATGGVAAPFSDDWTCGITLGDGNWPDLTSEAIVAAGRLVAPFDIAVPKGVQWHLLYKPHRVEETAFQVFRNWLVSLS